MEIDIDFCNALETRDKATRIETDLSFLGTLRRGETNIIMAPTGSGKSFNLLALSKHLSLDYKVLYISCENDIYTDAERLKRMDKGSGFKFEYIQK